MANYQKLITAALRQHSQRVWGWSPFDEVPECGDIYVLCDYYRYRRKTSLKGLKHEGVHLNFDGAEVTTDVKSNNLTGQYSSVEKKVENLGLSGAGDVFKAKMKYTFEFNSTQAMTVTGKSTSHQHFKNPETAARIIGRQLHGAKYPWDKYALVISDVWLVESCLVVGARSKGAKYSVDVGATLSAVPGLESGSGDVSYLNESSVGTLMVSKFPAEPNTGAKAAIAVKGWAYLGGDYSNIEVAHFHSIGGVG
jgi:hypothetical protein